MLMAGHRGFLREAASAGRPSWLDGCVAALALSSVFGLMGSTWRVDCDSPACEDRIGFVVAQASSGDSIIIGPGTYYEHIPIAGKSLTFLAPEGPERTVLDGSVTFPGREGSIIYAVGGASASLSLTGVTLRRGTGAVPPGGLRSGGAISWWNNFIGGCSLALTDCDFLSNSTGDSGGQGGAVYIFCVPDVRISSCRFRDNTAGYFGGALDILSCGGSFLISNCAFEVTPCAHHGGTAVYAEGGGDLKIENSRFTSTGDVSYMKMVTTRMDDVELTRNTFVSYSGGLATRLYFGSSGIGYSMQGLTLQGNVLWNPCSGDSICEEGIEIVLTQAEATIVENTLARCGISSDIPSGLPLECRNNIVYRGAASIRNVAGGSIRCNDAWPDSIHGEGENLVFERNISADPLFCNEGLGDFHIAWQSPCAEGNAPPGCGRIGALPEACDITPVRRITWGGIRGLFR